MDDKLLQQCRLLIINLLTAEKSIIKKDNFEMVLEGDKKKYIKNGLKPIQCNLKDWLKAADIEDGATARKRLRLVLKSIKELCDEARAITIKIDDDVKKRKSIS